MPRRHFAVLSIAVAPALAQSVTPFRLDPAAPRAVAFDKAPVPASILVSDGVAIADVDGDGRRDVLASALLASSATATGFRYHRNRGDGTFEDRSVSHVSPQQTGIGRFVTADLDGDGDVDVAGTFAILRNSQGVLVQELLPATTSARICVAAGDVDGDGDVDLFSGVGFGGGPSRQDRLLLNQGAGTFAYAPLAVLPVDNDDTAAARFADVDGDGDLDLVLAIEESGAGTGGARLYRNDGTGVFTDASAAFPVPQQDVTSLAVADFDRDGDVDVVLGVGAGLTGTALPDQYLRNQGGGQFVVVNNVLPPVLAPTCDVAAADLDGDGDDDLLLADGSSVRHGERRVYRNDGAAFTDVTAAWLAAEKYKGGRWGTGLLDGDALVDAVFVGGAADAIGTGRLRLYVGRGGTTFVDLNPPRCPAEAWGGPLDRGQLVDVDGDGDLDWFAPRATLTGPFGGAGQCLLRNDGQARFTNASGSLPPGIDAAAARFGDVDGDADLDLLLVTTTQVVQWRNDGQGNFVAAPPGAMPTGLSSLADLCLGDVDGDGDLDAFVGRSGFSTFDELLRNDGSGVFTRDTTALPTHSGAGVKSSAMLDHDGDGDLDLVLVLGSGFSTGTLTLYRNLGGGQFQTTTNVVPPITGVERLQTFDADSDGDLDLLLAKFSATELVRDQGATFVAATPPALQGVFGSAREPNPVDVDGDGDVDLVVDLQTDWRWLRNDGGFSYHLVPGVLADTYTAGRLAGGDLDADGDADFVLHEVSRPAAVVLGRAQQLYAPFLARLGSRYDLELHFLEDAVGRPSAVVFALGFARLTPAVALPPFGTLHVDPAGATFVVGAIAPPAEEVQPTSLRFTTVLPANPSLLGATVHSQALPLGGSRTTFTNPVSDVLF